MSGKFYTAPAMALASLILSAALPGAAAACACGCGIFDVGDGTLTPNASDSGFTGWFRYSYMDQNQNREGVHSAPAGDNNDLDLKTSFYTIGGEYVISRRWTVMAELPIYDRSLTTTDDGSKIGPAGSIYTGRITALGDLQLSLLYTGFSADLATGLMVGVKAPTGDDRGPIGPLGGALFDRDSLPGTGSTDLMVGGYHVGPLTRGGKLSYFTQARYQFAVATQGGYRPGNELDAAAGLSYDIGPAGPLRDIVPTVQVLNSLRAHDTGTAADTLNSGYERVLIAPGVRLKLNRKVDLYADVEVPLYQHVNAAQNLDIEGKSGQLTAPVLFKAQINYAF